MLRGPRDANVAQAAVADFETAVREFGHWIDKALEFVGSRYGVGVVDRSCIELLAVRPEGCPYREIADYLNLSAGEATALVSRLVRRGYARRERDPSDPDTFVVHAILDNDAVMAIFHARRAVLDSVIQDFDPDELAVVARYANYVSSVHPARLVEDAEQKVARTKIR
jgi:DNA-binding MarR family transcriptional regulator